MEELYNEIKHCKKKCQIGNSHSLCNNINNKLLKYLANENNESIKLNILVLEYFNNIMEITYHQFIHRFNINEYNNDSENEFEKPKNIFEIKKTKTKTKGKATGTNVQNKKYKRDKDKKEVADDIGYCIMEPYIYETFIHILENYDVLIDKKFVPTILKIYLLKNDNKILDSLLKKYSITNIVNITKMYLNSKEMEITINKFFSALKLDNSTEYLNYLISCHKYEKAISLLMNKVPPNYGTMLTLIGGCSVKKEISINLLDTIFTCGIKPEPQFLEFALFVDNDICTNYLIEIGTEITKKAFRICINKNYKKTKLMINKGYKLKISDIYACIEKDIPIKYFGENIKATTKMLELACWYGNKISNIENLINQGAKVNQQCLYNVVTNEIDEKKIDLLLENGAIVDNCFLFKILITQENKYAASYPDIKIDEYIPPHYSNCKVCNVNSDFMTNNNVSDYDSDDDIIFDEYDYTNNTLIKEHNNELLNNDEEIVVSDDDVDVEYIFLKSKDCNNDEEKHEKLKNKSVKPSKADRVRKTQKSDNKTKIKYVSESKYGSECEYGSEFYESESELDLKICKSKSKSKPKPKPKPKSKSKLGAIFY